MERQTDIRAVIFDMGGVILRTDNPAPRAELARRMGRSRAELEDIVFNSPVARQAERGQATQKMVWESAAAALGLPLSEVPALERDFFAGDSLDPVLVNLIAGLRARYRTALLSNTWVVDLPRLLREIYRLPDLFDVVVSSAALKTAKPDSEIFHRTLQMVGVMPEQAVFVDDNFDNVTAASALGIHTVRFFNTQQLLEDLKIFIDLPDGGSAIEPTRGPAQGSGD